MTALTETDSDIHQWQSVWNRSGRACVDSSANGGSVLGTLMAADGITTGLMHYSEQSWTGCIMEIARQMGISEGDSVFSVGCGAGADVYPLYLTLGCRVGGIDFAEAQIALARQAMPEFAAQFSVADAGYFDTTPRYRAVVCLGVLMYVPLSQAARIIERAVDKAEPGGAVAFCDIPRLSTKDQALAYRIEQAGSIEAYLVRYGPGFEHQYYPDGWVGREMQAAGLLGVRQIPLQMGDNGCSAFRDHFIGFKP